MRATRQVQEAQIDRVRADTEKAKASQADMESQVERNETLLTDAERTAKRQTELKAKGFVAGRHSTPRSRGAMHSVPRCPRRARSCCRRSADHRAGR